jgi:hypothetical protein
MATHVERHGAAEEGQQASHTRNDARPNRDRDEKLTGTNHGQSEAQMRRSRCSDGRDVANMLA